MSSYTPEHPWSRQIGEPQVWYRRFQAYLRLTPKRSLLAAYSLEKTRKSPKKPDSTPHNWRDTAQNFRWQERAIAWDVHEHELAVEELRAEARQWRQEQKMMARALKDRGKEMLEFPLAIEEEVKDAEGTKKIIYPSRWLHKEIPTFFSTANEIAKEAFEMDKPKLDEIAAIEILINAGWLPSSILDKASLGVRTLKESMQEAFKEELKIWNQEVEMGGK